MRCLRSPVTIRDCDNPQATRNARSEATTLSLRDKYQRPGSSTFLHRRFFCYLQVVDHANKRGLPVADFSDKQFNWCPVIPTPDASQETTSCEAFSFAGSRFATISPVRSSPSLFVVEVTAKDSACPKLARLGASWRQSVPKVPVARIASKLLGAMPPSLNSGNASSSVHVEKSRVSVDAHRQVDG